MQKLRENERALSRSQGPGNNIIIILSVTKLIGNVTIMYRCKKIHYCYKILLLFVIRGYITGYIKICGYSLTLILLTLIPFIVIIQSHCMVLCSTWHLLSIYYQELMSL